MKKSNGMEKLPACKNVAMKKMCVFQVTKFPHDYVSMIQSFKLQSSILVSINMRCPTIFDAGKLQNNLGDVNVN